jgi:hypothetical protein
MAMHKMKSVIWPHNDYLPSSYACSHFHPFIFIHIKVHLTMHILLAGHLRNLILNYKKTCEDFKLVSMHLIALPL